MKNVTKEFEVPLYKKTLKVFVGHDFEAFNSEVAYNLKDEYVIPSNNVEFYAYTIFGPFCKDGEKSGPKTVLIGLNMRHPFTSMNWGTVAHEAFHAAGYILDKVGVKYSFENDEAFAYLIEWIVVKIEEVIAEWDKENPK